MIVVIGSRHDRVAVSLAEGWPDASLLSAEDLTSVGWVWTEDSGAQQWVVGGQTIDDRAVTGVFIRRSTVLPEELTHIHPDDRAYLAAETQAFLIAMLGATRANVVNPVGDGALGDELVRPEQWMSAAAAAGLSLRQLRLLSRDRLEHQPIQCKVEVVGRRAFGDAPTSWRSSAVELVGSLNLAWAACAFDASGGLVALTSSAAPSVEAARALGELLAREHS